MLDSAYGKVNMTVRVRENNLLQKSHYDRMLQAPTYAEALNVLSDTKYRDDIDEAIRTKDYEPMLRKELKKTYDWVIDQLPNRKLAELISLPYAYHNMKVLFKEKITDKDFSKTLIDFSAFPLHEIRKAVQTQTSDILPDEYLTSIHQLYDFFEETPSLNDIDVYMDRIYDRHLMTLARETEEPEVTDYVANTVNLGNLVIFLRALANGNSANHIQAVLSDEGSVPVSYFVDLVPGGLEQAVNAMKNGPFKDILRDSDNTHDEVSLSQLERQIELREVEYLKQARMKVFGPLPVLAYINAVENEVKNLRLVLTSKLNNIDSDIVRDRMRLNDAI